ncbi:DUF262 domain-containing protein [Neobacillus drentensis]|uniref:DUF262 domain-containing protein n=1 Tax=Neobacillus drentensis TaxID=220684 RepID=UPI002FFE8034
MPIQRSGPVPPFFEYVTSKSLVPHTNGNTTSIISNLGVHEWVEIPRYQRGISWEMENVEEFLSSPSILLGNVILAQFQHNGQFPNLQSGNYLILVDGLQRFSVGTMLLAILHNKVFYANAPYHSSNSDFFNNLIARVFPLSPVYLHNDYEFLNHPRKAIANQYKRLRDVVENYVERMLSGGNGLRLSQSIQQTFLNRQVAVDIYFNFNGPIEIMNTFLGINTIRVDLGPVDLLRALIVEKGSTSGWTPIQIDDIENDFTAIFTNNDKPDSSLLPFVNVLLRTLRSNAIRVFPSWSGNLQIAEVDDFLDFIQAFKNQAQNGYFQEIKECGAIPYAILMSFYYTNIVHHGAQRPSFLSGGNAEDTELKSLLIASYRVLLDGTIGRTRVYAEQIMEGTLTHSLQGIADLISKDFIGKKTQQPLDWQWLVSNLNKVDKNKSKRVFNAMLLPDRGTVITNFYAICFGRSAVNFHIDHLIPQSLLSNAQGDEGETLRNFAPLPQSQNRAAKATHCSSKLSPNGIYANYLLGGSHYPHPYCEWLVNNYHTFTTPSDLDRPELLELNQNPDIGTERIQFIADVLISKI